MIVSDKNRRVYPSKTYSASPTAEAMSRKKSIPVVARQPHVSSGRHNHAALQATSSYASSIRIKDDRKLKGPATISQKQIYAASQKSSYSSSICPKDDKKLKIISPMIMITKISPVAVVLTGAALAAAGYCLAKNNKGNPEPSIVPEPSPPGNEEPPAPSVTPPAKPAPSVLPTAPVPSVSPPTAPVPSESTSTASKQFVDWLFAPPER